ncbi:MAG: UDP-4-amino-4,6-dideoxy-N-acetyl-beta-L-altrosamine transaminase [Rhodospirillaceae bacterium TMED8]|nr:UDP-4-amino-4,6-dideoxy-N-acetyl-beta-L-altrosamine transaminase [Magnetovibrio sp.]OUT50127.1 MAG: UDP-4-amino-4,6-dideoxy-N-acetyl-beta-L-altrosamine transaminase [Rhodospirillaceae bacterium TMED8]|tara:strand:- start:4136 stop:5350 length:1215 start_codon:yes stop_codon:yes gene_type:complete
MVNDRLPFLPYGRQVIDEKDIKAVTDVLRGEYLTTGPAVALFEHKLSEVTGAKYVSAISNGTAALHLAAMALDLAPGDHVVVPTITFLATANAARYVGAEVVFADVDAKTGLMTAETLAEACDKASGEVKAIFPVHVNGQTVDIPSLIEVPRVEASMIVEDACHALGGEQFTSKGSVVSVGRCADSIMSTFSFHPVKTIAMGEGGAITTNNAKIDQRIKRLRTVGMTRDPNEFQIHHQAHSSDGLINPWYYEMPELGFNYRASDIHCALGSSQLDKLNEFSKQRRALLSHYRMCLSVLAPIVEPLPERDELDKAWHLCVVHIDFKRIKKDRAVIMSELHKDGIGTQVHYIPVHQQPYYLARYGEAKLRGADQYYGSVLTLPLFSTMTNSDVERITETLKSVLGI